MPPSAPCDASGYKIDPGCEETQEEPGLLKVCSHEPVQLLDDAGRRLLVQNPMPDFAADTCRHKCGNNTVPHHVTQSDVARFLATESDLTVIPPDGFDRMISHVHMNGLMPDGLRQQRSMDYRCQLFPPARLAPKGLQLAFDEGKSSAKLRHFDVFIISGIRRMNHCFISSAT